MKPVALVTGASRGIGRAIALALAEADCHIAINYKANDEAARIVFEEAQRISSSFGNRVFLMKADCSRSEEVKELFAQVKNEVRTFPFCRHQLQLLTLRKAWKC